MVYINPMVKKFFIGLTFFVSVSILLAHNMTPHLHHAELSEEEHTRQHEEASSLLDWLMLGFHDDLGGGHLECFSHVKKIQLTPKWSCAIPLDFLIPNAFFTLLIQEISDDSPKDNPYHLLLAREQICHQSHLSNRPPPIS